jgi:hypothetical protein
MLIFIMGLEASFRFETHLTFEWTNWTFVIKSLPFEFVQLLQRHMGFFMSYPASVIFHGTSTNCTRNSRFLWFYMNLHDVNPQTLQSWQDLPAFLKTFKKNSKIQNKKSSLTLSKNHPALPHTVMAFFYLASSRGPHVPFSRDLVASRMSCSFCRKCHRRSPSSY